MLHQLQKLTLLPCLCVCADYGEFYMGTPAKQFTGCFDTGSSDTWLPSVACWDPSCTSHDRFNPRESSTFKVGPEPSNAPPVYIHTPTLGVHSDVWV